MPTSVIYVVPSLSVCIGPLVHPVKICYGFEIGGLRYRGWSVFPVIRWVPQAALARGQAVAGLWSGCMEAGRYSRLPHRYGSGGSDILAQRTSHSNLYQPVWNYAVNTHFIMLAFHLAYLSKFNRAIQNEPYFESYKYILYCTRQANI